MSGPIPKAPHLRALDGNPGKRAPRARRTPITAGAPMAPDGLDDVALREWRRVVPILVAEGLLSRLDRGLLTAYVTTWSRLLKATQALAGSEDMTVRGSHGSTQPRPELRIARDASALLIHLANALGLSPTSRARLGSKPVEPQSADDLPPELQASYRPKSGA